MGKFFNTVIMPMKKIPLRRTRRKDSLEGLRTLFNEEQVKTKQAPLYVSDKDRAKAEEEQNVATIRSTESTEARVTSPTGDGQSQPRTDIPVRRGRPERVRRIGKGVIAEARNK